MKIVTCICVDEEERDRHIKYPSTLDATSEKRRIIYWKCVCVFFATSIRCNPTAQQVLYTNDVLPIVIYELDIKKFLADLGVEIRYIPFQYFKPPAGYSDAFKNAFFKLDVIKALGMEESGKSILVDSDCLWTNHNPELENLIKPGYVLLYDVYKSYASTKGMHYRRRVNLGKLYRQINVHYPQTEPIQFGGEFLAGSSESFKLISQQLEEVYRLILSKLGKHPLRLDEENGIFDGDEFLSSYVYNNMSLNYIDAKGLIRRIWNSLRYSNATGNDLELTIWHMPSEKTQGIPLIFEKVIKPDSAFWHIPLDRFNVYLGKYLGVPQQLSPQRYFMLTNKVFEAILRYLISKQKLIKRSLHLVN